MDKIIILVLALGLLVSCIFNLKSCNRPVMPTYYDNPQVIYVDSGKVDSIPYPVYHRLPAILKRDTVYIDSPAIVTQIAEVDTVLGNDSLFVRYTFPPVNQFDFSLKTQPYIVYRDRVVLRTEWKELEESWITKPLIFMAGVGMTVIYKEIKK